MLKVYLAGPLFTSAEREFNRVLAEELNYTFGIQVFLPQDMEIRVGEGEKLSTYIFKADVKGIDWADVVLANMDGSDPDSGTCWECGYAYAMGKKVYTYRTDFRSNSESTDVKFNIMMFESSTYLDIDSSLIVDDMDDMVSCIANNFVKKLEEEGDL